MSCVIFFYTYIYVKFVISDYPLNYTFRVSYICVIFFLICILWGLLHQIFVISVLSFSHLHIPCDCHLCDFCYPCFCYTNYVMMLSLLSSVSRQEWFPCDNLTSRRRISSEFWMQWSLALNKSWCWFGVYCIPTHFQTRGPKVKKWMFLLFVHEEFIFHLILMGFFLMNSLGKYLSAKCIVLLCNYYHSYHEKGPNEGNFLLFLFYIRYDALFFVAKWSS